MNQGWFLPSRTLMMAYRRLEIHKTLCGVCIKEAQTKCQGNVRGIVHSQQVDLLEYGKSENFNIELFSCLP